MKKLLALSFTTVCLFFAILLTSCGGSGKSYDGPLGKEATIASKHISEIQSMSEKMKSLATSADNIKEAIELQKEINDYMKTAKEELDSFAAQNPDGKAVPFEQKGAKDVYEIIAIKFVGYNINASQNDVQSHFHAKVKVLKPGVPDGIDVDFVDAAGNILLKEKFYLGVGISEKPEPNKVIPMYCNYNKFSKILDLTEINVQ